MKVFISHSFDDTELARRVASGLRVRGFEPWLAEDEVLPGDNWAEAAGVALGDSEAMVTLVTPRSAGSAQLKMETGFALMNRNYERRVVPLVVGERTALPPDAFPWILEQYGVVDLPDESDLERAMDRVADHMREPDFAPSEMAAPAASAATALA